MKKIFAVLFAVMLLTGIYGSASACEGAECQEAYVNFSGQAASTQFAWDRSLWGWGNDFAKAGASGYSGYEGSAYAAGTIYADAYGYGWAENWSDAWANAWDYGLNSGAEGWAQTYGNAYTYGYAYGYGPCEAIYTGGFDGGPGYYEKQHGATAGEVKYFPNGHPQPQDKNEWVFLGADKVGGLQTVNLSILAGGHVWQYNEANEVGYAGAGAQGWNFSEAMFNERWDLTMADAYYAYADLGSGYYWYWYYDSPSAYTYGSTSVSVDPYGNERSASASTSNYSSVYAGNAWGGYYYNWVAPAYFNSFVAGCGAVNAWAAKGDTFAGGNAGFNYAGSSTYGAGSAYASGSIANYGSYSSASSSASASASIGGGCN